MDTEIIINAITDIFFYGGNLFVFDNITELHKITTKVMNIINQKQINSFSHKVSKEETIKLVEYFLQNFGFSYNIEKMLKNNNLIINDESLDLSNVLNIDVKGACVNENDKDIIIVNYNNSIMDSSTTIHELIHLSNYKEKRNYISDLLTESISYTYELIYCDSILNTKYHDDVLKYYQVLLNTMYIYNYKLSYLYKLIISFKEKDELNTKIYNKLFHTNDYRIALEIFNEYLQEERNIFVDSWYVLSFPIAISNFLKYKKDNNFLNNIRIYNNSINDKSFNECLNIINLDDLEYLRKKLDIILNEFISYINNIKENKNLLVK